jgi:hypothetical protein
MKLRFIPSCHAIARSLASSAESGWLLTRFGAIASVIAVGFDDLGFGSYSGFGELQRYLLGLGIGFIVLGAAVDQFKNRLFWKRCQDLWRFLLLGAQVGLLALIFRLFNVESQAFRNIIIPLVFWGFLIHHLLPRPLRIHFFLVLSLGAIFKVVGITNSLWIVGSGVLLIALCHLPVVFWKRVAALIIVGGFLVSFRGQWLPSPWPSIVWPILGSMFMFRLIVYMYDLHYKQGPKGFSAILSYFFMLPNIVFLLFPVVDSAAFRRNYYSEEWAKIYQRGIRWMFRGLVHLLLYRYINSTFVLAPENVATVRDLAQFLVSNILLYLRISGQFHLAVGILLLFGFNLHRTNNLYLLASSFTDFWRRINIYWKDFMLKIVFYPANFKLRRWSVSGGLIVSVLLVFIVTWFLHAFQWFWLRGEILLAPADIAFWSLFGGLVVVNTVVEARQGRNRIVGQGVLSFKQIMERCAKILLTFTAICVLWSLWTSESLREYLVMWLHIDVGISDVIAFPFFLLATIIIAAITFWRGQIFLRRWSRASMFTSPVAVLVSLIILYGLAGLSSINKIGTPISVVFNQIRVPRLSPRDEARMRQGYYEDLVGVNRFNLGLWEILNKRPDWWKKIDQTEIARHTGDFFWYELRPSMRIDFNGHPYSTNKWGMHDREYDLIPPAGAYRVALVGSSHVDGWGVGDNENFESLVEDRLNQKADEFGRSFEILNFAVGGYTPLQQLAIAETQVSKFRPNALWYIAHPVDIEKSIISLSKQVKRDIEMPYEYLHNVARRAGIDAKTPMEESRKMLEPLGTEIITWLYCRLFDISRKNGIRPVWILLPTEPGSRAPDIKEIPILLEIAKKAGFMIVDLQDIYDGLDVESLWVAEWDRHPNQLGHRIIANRLFEILSAEPATLGIPEKTDNGGEK